VAYCTNGQDIPNDLLLADRAELVRQCIDLAKHVVADNNVMVDEMTRLWKGQNQGA
jgi:flagellar biosynthesis GTPase FlhF